MGSLLRHVGSCLAACGLFVVVCGLLSICGMRVFPSLVVARGLCGCGARVPDHVVSIVCSTRALIEVRELSSCGARVALRHVGS